MAVLGNPRHERAAWVIAKGGTAELAAAAAGFDTEGRSFAPNARRLIQRPDIRERVRELQAEVAGKVTDITAEALHQVLWRIASQRLEDEDIEATHVIAAAREIGKMLGFYAPEKHVTSGNLTVEIVRFAADKDPPAS